MIEDYSLLVLFTFFLRTFSSTVGICHEPPSSREQLYSLHDACHGAVNYSYYLPHGYSFSDLNERAILQLSNISIDILPTSCLIAYKKAICSTIFLPCNVGSNKPLIDNTSSTRYEVPFQRPCLSICNDANKMCRGLLSLLNQSLDCSIRYDYSYSLLTAPPSGSLYQPYQYDQSDDKRFCNSMLGEFSVGTSVEPYLYQSTGFCSGIITELYIPQIWDTFRSEGFRGPYYVPMQPSFIIQDLIEKELKESIEAILPLSLDDKCHFSLRNYFCRTYMLQYQKVTLHDTLIRKRNFITEDTKSHYSYFEPVYPSRSLIDEVLLNCGNLQQYFPLSSAPYLILQYYSNLENSNGTNVSLPISKPKSSPIDRGQKSFQSNSSLKNFALNNVQTFEISVNSTE